MTARNKTKIPMAMPHLFKSKNSSIYLVYSLLSARNNLQFLRCLCGFQFNIKLWQLRLIEMKTTVICHLWHLSLVAHTIHTCCQNHLLRTAEKWNIHTNHQEKFNIFPLFLLFYSAKHLLTHTSKQINCEKAFL